MKLSRIMSLVEQRAINSSRTKATVAGKFKGTDDHATLNIEITNQLYDDVKEGGGWEGKITAVAGNPKEVKVKRGDPVEVFLDANTKEVTVKSTGNDKWTMTSASKANSKKVNESEDSFGKFDGYSKGDEFTLKGKGKDGSSHTVKLEVSRKQPIKDGKLTMTAFVLDDSGAFDEGIVDSGHLVNVVVEPGGNSWTVGRRGEPNLKS